MTTPEEELLQRAEKLQREAEAADKASSKKRKAVMGGAQGHIEDIHETVVQVKGTIGWIYRHIIEPVVTHPWVRKPFLWYRKLWIAVVYKEGAEEGEEIFSKERAGLMVLFTLICLRLLPFFLSGAAEFVWDGSRMLMSYEEKQVWYLGKSQEIDPEGNVFSAQGCASIECSDQTSMYFRIKPSLMHHLWSLYHNQNMFFPDFVSGGIQNDINKCLVTGYGGRSKYLVRNWDVYPQILSVECAPLTQEDIQDGMQK